MNIKKIISFALSLVMASGAFAPCVLADENEEKDYSGYAEYTFGIKPTKINIDSYWIGDEQVVEWEGRRALKRSTLESQLYFTMALNPKEFAAPEGESLVVSIDYWDGDPSGCFTIAYDGINNKQYYGHWHTNAEDIVRLQGTNEWKTYDFYLDDIRCVKGYDGSDLRIGLWADEMGRSMGDVYISSVRIKKTFPRKPIKTELTSDMVGNIFGPGEKKDINVAFENITEVDFKSELDYTVYDYDKNPVFSDKLEVDMPAGEKNSAVINLDKIDTFGVYTLETKLISTGIVEGSEQSFESDKTIDVSYINKPDRDVRNPVQNVCSHGVWHGAENSAKVAGYAGFGSVRDEIIWNKVETERKKYAVPEEDDKYVQLVKNENMDYLMLLSFGNFLYDNTDPPDERIAPNSVDGYEGYAGYAKHMAETYKGYFKYFEVWNEYNFTVFNSRNEDGANYARMLKYTYEALKSVDKDVTVAGMGFAGTQIDMMKEVLDNGGYDYMDVVSCHPYDWSGEFRNDYFVERLREVQELFDQYGGRKPVWLTEYGMNSSTQYTGVSELEQAESVMQVYGLALGEQVADKIWWYDLQNDGEDTTAQESMWGLVKSVYDPVTPWAAKPAFAVMAGMNNLMTDAVPDGKVVTDNDTLRAYNFKSRFGDDIAMAWSTDGSKTLGLDLGCKEIELLDMYTNSLGKITSQDGHYNIELTSTPIYIGGNFTKFEEGSGSIAQSTSEVRAAENDSFDVTFADKLNRDLTIETSVPEGVEITQNTGIVNGSGTLSFKTAESDGSYNVGIKVKSGAETLLFSHVRISVGTPIEAEIADYEQINAEDDMHWRSVIKVKNTTKSSIISGECTPLGDEEMTLHTKPVKFFNLRPGDTQTIYMNLPEMTKKRVRMLEYEIKLDSGYSTTVTKQTDFTSAAYTDTPPEIDGNVRADEWKGVWLCADEEQNIREIKDWRGPKDISYDCNMMWDYDNLYMAVIVTDDAFCQNEIPSMQWRGDGVQFGIEDRVYEGKAIVDGFGSNEVFTEVAIALLNTGENMYRFGTISDAVPSGECENFKAKIIRGDGVTTYEIAVPWSEMFGEGYKPDENITYGFSMLVNDNDGTGRRGWAEYNDGIGSAKNAMLFGKLRLTK